MEADKQSLIDYLRTRLPELAPIHNLATHGLIFVGGDPGEVVVQVTDDSVIVSVFAIVWDASRTLRQSRLEATSR